MQALPPTAALMELKGALRILGPDTHRLGEILRVRILSRLGVDVRVGIGPSITVAATASAQVAPPGGVLTVAPGRVTKGSPRRRSKPSTVSAPSGRRTA
ncbi:hypothetical protein SAM23877_7389 [Streptomyces ambofaciens ATCC 23877]|uniref:Uncharacterized protein SAMR0240 n=2 Tax=Streptomyces ambofaciens TaxID=1889 RepID=Q1RQJ6_STRA7|nr:hypothetical protein SAM23877_7389 [Streptomyces ambofaciens ATCC 23877]CAI78443.1 conserved hypothetical protein [Streptomyces ambofaciens ATCC 23877]CAJ87950.1 conserved hypothetical protein [Streptomyces ambofaciens ATCC 23877]